MLRFNINAFSSEFLEILEEELKNVVEIWEQDVCKYMENPYFKGLKSFKEIVKKEGRRVIVELKASPAVIADSYGTGSLMLDNIPGFQEYKNSDRYNKNRKGKAIEGRKAGTYKHSLTGKKRTTTGSFAGRNIEGQRVNSQGRPYYILPSHPSYALQLAQEYMYMQWLPQAYKNTMRRINFAKFLIES